MEKVGNSLYISTIIASTLLHLVIGTDLPRVGHCSDSLSPMLLGLNKCDNNSQGQGGQFSLYFNNNLIPKRHFV